MTNDMIGYSNDKLKLLHGDSYLVNDVISIRQPTLNEISDFGEMKYFNMVKLLTSTPTDLCCQLDDIGIDFTKISAWELFYSFSLKSFSSEELSILFNGLYLENYKIYKSENQGTILFDSVNDIVIDEFTYEVIVDFLREMHGLRKNEKRPYNNSAKAAMIEDAREALALSGSKKSDSILANQISALVNTQESKYNWDNVWDLTIYRFLNSINRINKIKNANLLLQSGYSGFGIDINKLNKESYNWLGEL